MSYRECWCPIECFRKCYSFQSWGTMRQCMKYHSSSSHLCRCRWCYNTSRKWWCRRHWWKFCFCKSMQTHFQSRRFPRTYPLKFHSWGSHSRKTQLHQKQSKLCSYPLGYSFQHEHTSTPPKGCPARSSTLSNCLWSWSMPFHEHILQ